MTHKLFLLVALFALTCWSDEASIRKQLTDSLSSHIEDNSAAYEKFMVDISQESVGALTSRELDSLAPLVNRCLSSAQIATQRRGLVFVLTLSLRLDSASLMAPFNPGLERIAADPKSPLRQGALFAIGNAHPALRSDEIEFLRKQLKDPTHSPEEHRLVAVTLIEASRQDEKLLPEVLDYAGHDPNTEVTTGALAQLRVSRIFSPPAIRFISSCLDHADPGVRGQALQTIDSGDSTVKISLIDPLRRVSENEKETAENRKLAAQLLSEAR